MRYNDGDIKEVKANKGITFAYNPADVEMVRIAYDSALTPGGMTEEQKPEGVYAFAQSSIAPELSFAEVPSRRFSIKARRGRWRLYPTARIQ